MKTYQFTWAQNSNIVLDINFGSKLLLKKGGRNFTRYANAKNNTLRFTDETGLLVIRDIDIEDGFYEVIKSNKKEAILVQVDVDNNYPDISGIMDLPFEYESNVETNDSGRALCVFLKSFPGLLNPKKTMDAFNHITFETAHTHSPETPVRFSGSQSDYYLMPLYPID